MSELDSVIVSLPDTAALGGMSTSVKLAQDTVDIMSGTNIQQGPEEISIPSDDQAVLYDILDQIEGSDPAAILSAAQEENPNGMSKVAENRCTVLPEDGEEAEQTLEQMFTERYTEKDVDFMATVSKELTSPPIVCPWFTKSKHGFHRGRGRSSGYHDSRQQPYHDRGFQGHQNHWGQNHGQGHYHSNRDHASFRQHPYEHRHSNYRERSRERYHNHPGQRDQWQGHQSYQRSEERFYQDSRRHYYQERQQQQSRSGQRRADEYS